jgi:hypothetical protein
VRDVCPNGVLNKYVLKIVKKEEGGKQRLVGTTEYFAEKNVILQRPEKTRRIGRGRFLKKFNKKDDPAKNMTTVKNR